MSLSSGNSIWLILRDKYHMGGTRAGIYEK